MDKDRNSVNHPSHYNQGSFEVIDVIEDWKLGFNLGNAVKYIARADYKGNRVEDLRKASWYLNREIKRLTKAIEGDALEKDKETSFEKKESRR